MYVIRRPAAESRTTDLRALGECRVYMDSLQNEQFCLPHLHILHYYSTLFLWSSYGTNITVTLDPSSLVILLRIFKFILLILLIIAKW